MSKLSKMLERLDKVNENIERVKSGKPVIRNTSAISELEKIKRREEKVRKEYLAAVMADRSDILQGITNFDRIEDNAPVQEKAIEQSREYLSAEIDTQLAILDIQKFALLIKRSVADKDIDSLNDASEDISDFNDALQAYTIDVISNGQEVNEHVICGLWNDVVTEESNDVLMRGTTVYDSIDFHVNQVMDEIKNGFYNNLWRTDIVERLSRLFNKYHVETDRGDMKDILLEI